MRKKIVVATALVVAAIAGAVYAVAPAKVVVDAVAVLKASGMSCGACAGRVEKALKGEKGVEKVEVDLERKRIAAYIDSHQAAPADLAKKVTALGYPASVASVVPVAEYSGAKAGEVTSGGCGCCNKGKGK